MKFCILVSALCILLCPVAFAQWEPDRRLSTADSFSTWLVYPNANRIAAGANSDLHVVWYDERDEGNGQGAEIYYLRSTDDGTDWSTDVRLTNAPGWSTHPSVVVEDSTVHVAWMDLRANSEVYYLRSTDLGATWASELRLTNTSQMSQVPCVAAQGENVHVVWDENFGTNFEIHYRRSTDNGNTWLTTVPLTDDPGLSRFPSVAASGSNVHVVWFDDRDGNYNIYYKRSSDDGATWASDLKVTADPDTQWYPHVACSGSNVVVAWSDKRGADADPYVRRSTDDGLTWLAETALSTAYRNQADPCVAVRGRNIHVSWTDDRDAWPNFEVYYKNSTDFGATWADDLRLTDDDAFSTGTSVVAAGAGVHVVWRDCRDTPYGDVFYKRNPSGNTAVKEAMSDECRAMSDGASIVRGVLFLPRDMGAGHSCENGDCPASNSMRCSGGLSPVFAKPALLNIIGRKVLDLKPGPNDVSRLAPGVYFVLEAHAQAQAQAQAARKAVIQR